MSLRRGRQHRALRRAGALLVLALPVIVVLSGGCAQDRRTVADAFPIARVAAPWILEGEVWSGTFEEAAPALGDDADTWAKFSPTRVWLARYTREGAPQRVLTVRCFAFDTPETARAAFEVFRPPLAKPLKAGDVGCWTDFGVLFQWQRLVFDIFGDDASWGSEVHSSVLAAIITRRMPRGLPENPR